MEDTAYQGAMSNFLLIQSAQASDGSLEVNAHLIFENAHGGLKRDRMSPINVIPKSLTDQMFLREPPAFATGSIWLAYDKDCAKAVALDRLGGIDGTLRDIAIKEEGVLATEAQKKPREVP